MKKLLLILILCGSTQAATYNLSTSINASSLGLVAGDIVNIQSGGLLTADVGFTCQKITNVTGGTFRILNTFVRVNCDTITQSGGDWNMVAADTIYCKRISITGGTTNWVGTASRPVIIRASSGFASCLFSGTSSQFVMYQVKFVNMVAQSPGTNDGGVKFMTITNPALHALSYIMVDTGTLCLASVTGLKINGGYVKKRGVSGNVTVPLLSCTSDTLQGMYIITDAQTHGVYTNAGTHNVFISDTIIAAASGGSGYYANITLAGGNYHVIRNCTLYGLNEACIMTGGATANDSLFFNNMTGGTHEQIHSDKAGCNNWYLAGNVIRGGGARGLITAMYGFNANGWKLYYNTVASSGGGAGKGAFDIGCVTGTGCGVTGTGWEKVGNIFTCSNATYGDINIDGGSTLTLTHFKNNAFHEIDTSLSGAHYNVPAGEWTTNQITNQYRFADSVTYFTLANGSPMINAGDSAVFVEVFGIGHAGDAPGDIGAYQTYTGGTGGNPPTGACCQTDGTCATITQTQCIQQGGAYHGDGSLCADYDCTQGGGGPGPGPGTGPAPLSKQFAIWWLTYRAPCWATANDGNYSTILRDWMANRANGVIGANTKTDFDYMKTVNPSLLGATYAVMAYYDFDSSVYAQDTTTLKNWCDSMFSLTGEWRYKVDSVVLRATGGTFACDPDQKGTLTTAVGRIGRYNYFGGTSHRYMFDFRNAQTVAEYQWYKQHRALVAAGTTFIMLDEEGLAGTTGRTNSGNGPPVPPFKSASQWSSGFNNFQKPFWTTNFTTLSDSISNMRTDVYAKVLGDSMRANGYHMIPNGAAYWGPHAGNPNNWTNEALETIDNYGGALLGENYAFAAMAGNAGGALGANRHLIGRLGAVKDSGMDLAIWFECGPYDSTLGISQRRYKMGALGLMLMGTFPGTTHYYWVPNPGYNYTNFRMPQSGAPQNYAVDTTWLWSYAWGKYFGAAMSTRDSSQTGTDAASQAYTIWKVALTHPTNGTSDTLTFACGRWYQGSNIDTATTGVNVTLPGAVSKKWYLLKDNSGASGVAGLASWSTTVYSGGDAVKVGNAHWLVFSSDTVLANNGVSDTTLVNIGDSKIEGQSVDFTVALNKTLQVVDSFFVTLTSGTATKGVDFTDVGGWYTISPGSLSTTVSVPTTDDILVEGNETFTMTISLAKYGRIATATATGTIIENDIAGQPGTAMHLNHWRRY